MQIVLGGQTHPARSAQLGRGTSGPSVEAIELWRSNLPSFPVSTGSTVSADICPTPPENRSPAALSSSESSNELAGDEGSERPQTPLDIDLEQEWQGTSDENAQKAIKQYGDQQYWQFVRERELDILKRIDPIWVYRQEQDEERAEKQFRKRRLAELQAKEEMLSST